MLNKSRLGFSITLISVATFLGVLANPRKMISPGTLAYICIGVAGLGLVLWLVGQFIQRPRRQDEFITTSPGVEPEEQEDPRGHWLSEFTSFRHLGFVLVASAAAVFCLAPKQGADLSGVTVVAARPATPPSPSKTPPPQAKSRPAKTNSPPATAESAVPAPVVFPKLKLAGIIMNGSASTAVINGRTVQVGDYVEAVKVVVIESKTVTVEFSGERMTIELP